MRCEKKEGKKENARKRTAEKEKGGGIQPPKRQRPALSWEPVLLVLEGLGFGGHKKGKDKDNSTGQGKKGNEDST